MKISAVVNTLNEEKNIARCLESVKWADEIVVVDDGSTDKTVAIAQKYTDKIYHHQSVGYVEPARVFAMDKASYDWIFLIDADEEAPKELADILQSTDYGKEDIAHVQIPRKNLIFGQWIKHTGWWPDYQVRFFQKGTVIWPNAIHLKPQTFGRELRLEAREDLAIVNQNYDTVSQFINRMNRYTDIEAQEKINQGYKFVWPDLILKPTEEFMRRFFAWEGYKDGLHGLALSLLQAFSLLVFYIKIWEKQGFRQEDIDIKQITQESKQINSHFNYWTRQALGKKSWWKRFL
ncbi:glycosyltransferase family 2 protein [Candidatus Daviesbacteria bacterium]|nr:glycosyltransferase family 2 protein [Candidatus Daviesbacteria bacterium]